MLNNKLYILPIISCQYDQLTLLIKVWTVQFDLIDPQILLFMMGTEIFKIHAYQAD